MTASAVRQFGPAVVVLVVVVAVVEAGIVPVGGLPPLGVQVVLLGVRLRGLLSGVGVVRQPRAEGLMAAVPEVVPDVVPTGASRICGGAVAGTVPEPDVVVRCAVAHRVASARGCAVAEPAPEPDVVVP